MKFTLCTIEYPFKVTYGACKEYEEETNRCLETDLLFVLHEYSKAATHDEGVERVTIEIGREIGVINACQLLYTISKACNTQVTIDQIWDGMHHSAFLGDGQSWHLVLFMAATEYFEERRKLSKEKMAVSS